MPVEIITIRHGETHYNRENRIQGSLDSSLTDKGEKETVLLGRYLNRWLDSVDEWIVSPLGRARQTSAILRTEVKKPLPEEQVDTRLKEIFCGHLEGKTQDEIDPVVLHRLRNEPDFAYPGGESIIDVMERADGFIQDRVKRKDGSDYRVVIVAHGNFNRSFAASLTGLGSSFAMSSIQSNTGLNRFFSYDGLKFKILTWNDTSHTLMS